ncbi:class I adenylate-forming enzyme family protein [Pseudaestuariivita sp.]|uniref:class I adenylate-forming enzyme family protein n=1 Tax=Pseudaestuariivita sp. TaxID=2211669 RepID=UPI004059D943
MTLDAWIVGAAEAQPGHFAILFEDEALSYAAFAALIAERTDELRAKGIGHGDRVAWYGLNAPEVFVLIFACARIGAIFVPLNWRLADEEIARIVSDCAPSAVYWDEAFAEKAAALPVAKPEGKDTEPSLGDPLLIVYTSGSTGEPKGAVLAQEALVANAEMSVAAHGLTADDTVLSILPTFHVGGLNILPTPAFSVGATVLLHRTFDPVAAVKDLAKAQTAVTVPTVLGAMLGTEAWKTADLSGVRCLSIGSTDVPRELIDAVHARGIPMMQIYGATETAPFAIYQTHEDAIETAGSLGRKGTCEVRLVTPEGRAAQDGAPGEIWVRGRNVALGYWRNDALTDAAFEDGWFKTGDVATCDADGQYFFADRIKHIIISGGENIYSAEIERILRTHPTIKELSVVGLPHPKWGETPVVVAVKSAPLEGKDLLAMLDGTLARYKHPREVLFADALPRNAMGKVVAEEVRKLATSLKAKC